MKLLDAPDFKKNAFITIKTYGRLIDEDEKFMKSSIGLNHESGLRRGLYREIHEYVTKAQRELKINCLEY